MLNEAKRNRGKKYRKECRIYQCPNEECKGLYHLTSEEEYNEKEIIPLEDLLKRLADTEQQICFIGDCTEKYKDLILSYIPEALFAPRNLNIARASSLGELGLKKLQKNEFENLYSFAPVYLRKSQAEQQYEKKLQEQKE